MSLLVVLESSFVWGIEAERVSAIVPRTAARGRRLRDPAAALGWPAGTESQRVLLVQSARGECPVVVRQRVVLRSIERAQLLVLPEILHCTRIGRIFTAVAFDETSPVLVADPDGFWLIDPM